MKGLFIPEITVEMFRNGCLEAIEAIMAEGEIYDIDYDLKSAQPRKKGKWIDRSYDIDGVWNYCSVCMEQAIDLYDFCPNCGADMREDT